MSQSSQSYSLQQRLVWRTVIGFTLVWTVVVGWVVVDARHELDELLDAHLIQTASLLLVQQTSDGDDDDVMATRSSNKYSANVAYQVFREGELVAASANAGNKELALHTQGFASVQRTDGQSWRVYTAYATHSDVRVYVAEALSGRMDIVWALLRGMLLPFALALPLWGLVVWLSTRSSLLPLADLRHQLITKATATMSPVHVSDLPAEVQPLEDALNAMLSQLAERMETERRFTADAAHELRTPIAAIRAQAQVALLASSEASSTLRLQALQDTIRACDRATRVVEQLLNLSRLEAQSTVSPMTVSVQTVMQQVAADLAPTAMQRQQQLEVLNHVIDSSVLMQTCPEPVLEMMLRNLLDNALRYAPDQGRVRVILRDTTQQTLELVFEDSGSGMTEIDMTRLGERFFRVLGSGKSGSGLGWSIVRRIAQVHNIQVHLSRSQDLGGLQVTLQMHSKA